MSRVLYIQYTNPGGYPPLQHSSRILAEAGWKVLFLGTGAFGADSLEFPVHPNITVKRMAFRVPGWRQKLHYFAFCVWSLWTALVWRPSLVYASDPFSCPIAWILTWIPGLRVFYHEHDSPSAAAGCHWFQSFIFRTRCWLARRADFCILPNEVRLERFKAELGPVRNAVCVWNCPALREALKERRSDATTPIWLLYHGSIVPERLPPAVIGALALLPDSVRLRVVGYETIGSHGYVAALRRQAEALGIGNRVEFLAPISREELMKATQMSDIGLALLPASSADQNFQSMPGASNKAFDYLACGLPVIVSDLHDWHEMFVAPGYGLACNPGDPTSIAAAIGWLIDHPDQMRQMGESGRRKILSEWNYESVFQPVMQYLSNPDSVGKSAVKDSRFQDAR